MTLEDESSEADVGRWRIRVESLPRWQRVSLFATFVLAGGVYFVFSPRLAISLHALLVVTTLCRFEFRRRPQQLHFDVGPSDDIRLVRPPVWWFFGWSLVLHEEQRELTLLRRLTRAEAEYIAYVLREPPRAPLDANPGAAARPDWSRVRVVRSEDDWVRQVVCSCCEHAFHFGRSECSFCGTRYQYRNGLPQAVRPYARIHREEVGFLTLRLGLVGAIAVLVVISIVVARVVFFTPEVKRSDQSNIPFTL